MSLFWIVIRQLAQIEAMVCVDWYSLYLITVYLNFPRILYADLYFFVNCYKV